MSQKENKDKYGMLLGNTANNASHKDLLKAFNTEMKKSLLNQNPKSSTLKKSSSRQALKDIGNIPSFNKKRKTSTGREKGSRPTSAKSGSKRRNNSHNKSRSKDRSKQNSMKELSHSKKQGDGHVLLKNLKNSHKGSTLGPILDAIESDNIRNKPPKAPKHARMNVRENIKLNLDQLCLTKKRSRQPLDLNKK